MFRISQKFEEAGIDDPLTLVKIEYAAEIFKNEFVKFIVMAILFFVIGKFPLYIFALAILLPVRVFSGGLHMKTKMACFLFSLLIFVLAICILPLLRIPVWAVLATLLVAIAAILFCSPIATEKRPIKSTKRYRALKIRSVVFALLSGTILVLLFAQAEINYFIVGAWMLIMHSLQLFAAWLRDRKKKGV
jgi:accessory gene regulator B